MRPEPNWDELSVASLTEALGGADEIAVAVYPSIDSTNQEAKRRARSGERQALIVAETQTAGRGRLGRSFYSPDATGVYFSVLYTVNAPLSDAVAVTSAAAVAVMRAIKRVCGLQTEIKWVNDLYLDGKKVCGILAESVPVEGGIGIVVGVGINLRDADFPDTLAEIAGTLHTDVSRAELIAAVYRELLPYLAETTDRSWLDDYRHHSFVLGHPITWTRGGECFEGVALDIDEDGGLVVCDRLGAVQTLSSGEISVRRQE